MTENRKKKVLEEEKKEAFAGEPTMEMLHAAITGERTQLRNVRGYLERFMKMTNSRFSDFRQQTADKDALNSSMTEELTTLRSKLERATSKLSKRTKRQKRNSPPNDKEFEEELAGGSKNSYNSNGDEKPFEEEENTVLTFSCKTCTFTTHETLHLHMHYQKHEKAPEEDPPASNVETPEEIRCRKCTYTTLNRKE